MTIIKDPFGGVHSYPDEVMYAAEDELRSMRQLYCIIPEGTVVSINGEKVMLKQDTGMYLHMNNLHLELCVNYKK